jgi:cytochrome c biogenesis protein CcdA
MPVQQWMQQSLVADPHGFAVLPAAFLLGLLGAVSSCCSLPVLGAVAGYAGTIGGRPDRRRLILIGVSLMVGTALSLAVVGAVTGFVGQVAGATLGRYWRFVGGLVMVLFGLSALRLLSVRIPKIEIGTRVLCGGLAPAGGGTDSAGRTAPPGGTAPTGGAASAVVYGLAVGGATTACSVCCNPVLPVAVGAVALKGAPVLGAAILAVFALGYSLPLAAGMVGLGFGLGRLGAAARRIMPVVQVGFGLMLIGVGFYLLTKS